MRKYTSPVDGGLRLGGLKGHGDGVEGRIARQRVHHLVIREDVGVHPGLFGCNTHLGAGDAMTPAVRKADDSLADCISDFHWRIDETDATGDAHCRTF